VAFMVTANNIKLLRRGVNNKKQLLNKIIH
jgi:hypothetical protein